VTRVKICGITRLQDALAAVEAGADALGFNFWPGSSRYIAPTRTRRIVEQLPPLVTPVALFVNESTAGVKRKAKLAGITTVQLHGDESPMQAKALVRAGLTVFKAVSVGQGFRAARLRAYKNVAGFLLDTKVEGLRGGTGKVFDWAKARAARRYGKIFLAGGLTPANVARAIRAARPYAVDVSSGVERRPGIKDTKKVREFIRRAKQTKFTG
jgi:phosphoribosylanthranilate isomerase